MKRLVLYRNEKKCIKRHKNTTRNLLTGIFMIMTHELLLTSRVRTEEEKKLFAQNLQKTSTYNEKDSCTMCGHGCGPLKHTYKIFAIN